MKLYTFYKHENRVVYGMTVDGKVYFFFKGFNSADEAKKVTTQAHVEYTKVDRPKAPIGILRAEIEMILISGDWTEIE